MKRTLLRLTLLAALLLPAAAQAGFTGTAEMGYSALIDDRGFDSALNPDNALDLKEAGFDTALTARLDGGDDKTVFSAWFSLKQYPIGMGLTAASYGDTTQQGAALQFIQSAGDTIVSFDIMRFSAHVFLTDSLSIEVGRQSMLTGYGYGWNPIDFADPLKDPSDPDGELRGVDALSVNLDLGYAASLKVYGLLPRDLLAGGSDFGEIKGGGEVTVYLPGLELKLAGIYDYDSSEGTDAYTPATGTGFMADILGWGIYGEAALRRGSRNYFWDGSATGFSRKEGWLFSALAGLEYTFPGETSLVGEYFYNGEGYDKSERSAMKDSIDAVVGLYGSPTADLYASYGTGYFARHYIMLSLMQPLYALSTDLNLAALFSPDSGALTVFPSVSYNFSGSFSGRIDYVGMWDCYEDDFSEVTAQPVQHSLRLVFTYSF